MVSGMIMALTAANSCHDYLVAIVIGLSRVCASHTDLWHWPWTLEELSCTVRSSKVTLRRKYSRLYVPLSQWAYVSISLSTFFARAVRVNCQKMGEQFREIMEQSHDRICWSSQWCCTLTTSKGHVDVASTPYHPDWNSFLPLVSNLRPKKLWKVFRCNGLFTQFDAPYADHDYNFSDAMILLPFKTAGKWRNLASLISERWNFFKTNGFTTALFQCCKL